MNIRYPIYEGVYRILTVDRVARLPRQFGQESVILRGNLSSEPRANFYIHGRGA